MSNNKMLFYIGSIAIFTIILGYLFMPFDLIPAKFAGAVVGHLDDAAVVILGLIAFKKLKNQTIGGSDSEMKYAGMGPLGWVIFIPILSAGIWYVFWGVNLIPRQVPYIGLIDNIIAVILMFVVFGRIRQSLYGKK